MKYAFFQGCNIPIRIPQYATSMMAVMSSFGIELDVVPEFNCCGYPVRNVDEKAYFLPSIRNMAIAEKRGQDIVVACNCCFASLQKARNVAELNPALQEEMNNILAKEGLYYSGKAEIKHYLSVLFEEITPETLRKKLTAMFTELKVAVIHGCHILRPREITRFDDSFVPRITDALLSVTRTTSLEWQGKLECCGAALAGINNDLSHQLLLDKISTARSAGAKFIVPVCSYCFLQFDTMQLNIKEKIPQQEVLPVVLLPQLLGLCLGLNENQLGLEQNKTLTSGARQELQALLGPPVEDKKKKRKKARVEA